jgi:hypothetical protein
MSQITKFIKNPSLIFGALGHRGFFNWMSDEKYLKILYKLRTGQKLNLDDPQTFNEKLQWLKLHDRRPEYTTMVDKYAVKKYVADKIGKQYIIPTLGAWDKFDDIDFDKLPDQFVLKCTHDSGGLVICRDKSKLDIKAAKKKLNRCLKHNYYWGNREWCYKNVKPRIIAEKYMEEKGKAVPEDYKIYCMNGEPKYIVVFHNRFDSSKPLSETVYDTNWQPQHISLDEHFAVSEEITLKPECLDEILDITKALCADIPQVRVDFYIIENRIYFGEITLYTASGFQKMIPEEMDIRLGQMLQLSKKVG